MVQSGRQRLGGPALFDLRLGQRRALCALAEVDDGHLGGNPGSSGHSYAFYASVVDGAGNSEPAKTAAEATIAVNGAFADPTVANAGGSGGGGCVIGGDGRRDPSLPLLVLLASIALALGRKRSRHGAQP